MLNVFGVQGSDSIYLATKTHTGAHRIQFIDIRKLQVHNSFRKYKKSLSIGKKIFNESKRLYLIKD